MISNLLLKHFRVFLSNKKPAGQLFSFVFCRTPSILRKISPTQPTKTLSATFRNDSLFRKAYHTYITFIKNAFASGCGLPLPQRQRRFLSAENNKRKEKRGKMRRERKKCGKKKGKKTKSGKKKDRKKVKGKSKAGKTERAGKRRTENDKEQNGKSHKFSPTTSQAPGFRDTKNARSERRRRFGLKAERPYLAVIGLRL